MMPDQQPVNRITIELNKFADEFKQLCEKYDVIVYSNYYHNIGVVRNGFDDGVNVVYLKGDHVC